MRKTPTLRVRNLSTLSLVSLLCLGGVLQAQPPQQLQPQQPLGVPVTQTPPPVQVPMIAGANEYELGPGDVVEIQIPFGEEINGTYAVDRTGSLTVNLLGRVEAEGRTLAELEADVTEKAAQILKDPQAIVSLIQKRVMQVTITGSVVRPSIYQVDGVTTLLEVLAQAGGPSMDAGPIIRISRRQDEGPIPHPDAQTDELGRSVVDIAKDDVMNLRGETNLVLKPGDIVSIEMAEMVYVMAGGVQGRIPLEDAGQISVVNALVRAGVQPGDKADESTILRKIADSALQGESLVIDPVDVEKIFKGESPDVLLYPDDLLYVPADDGRPGLGERILDGGVNSGINFLTWGLL